jgi:hypothetical protein
MLEYIPEIKVKNLRQDFENLDEKLEKIYNQSKNIVYSTLVFIIYFILQYLKKIFS